MLFNSHEFIFAFLPVLFFVHFYLSRRCGPLVAKLWLVLGSLFFYGFWKPVYVPLILFSMLVNYGFGAALSAMPGQMPGALRNAFSIQRSKQLGGVPLAAQAGAGPGSRTLLALGVLFNVLLLGYFKYVDFFLENFNSLFGSNIPLPHVVLPLGISFFTFTQIAFLVDAYRREAREYSLINYMLFVTYFPHLLAGPILHHKEMMPQFARTRNFVRSYRNIALGLFVFALGLAKKVIIADTFAGWANQGFAVPDQLTMLEAWATSLSYTFQLYFDFSGYTDMAIGISLLFNIRLPINFNSPYKALDIQDFWRRWHITLSRFLRNYVYIPLGGNRKGSLGTYRNLLLTFLIGGLWHGAGWTFVFWGALHGGALVVHRVWQRLGMRLPKALAWLITFNFVNLAWVFFRADSWANAMALLKAMFAVERLVILAGLQPWLGFLQDYGIRFGAAIPVLDDDGGKFLLVALLAAFGLVLLCRNSMEHMQGFAPRRRELLLFVLCCVGGLLFMSKTSEFIYFNF